MREVPAHSFNRGRDCSTSPSRPVAELGVALTSREPRPLLEPRLSQPVGCHPKPECIKGSRGRPRGGERDQVLPSGGWEAQEGRLQSPPHSGSSCGSDSTGLSSPSRTHPGSHEARSRELSPASPAGQEPCYGLHSMLVTVMCIWYMVGKKYRASQMFFALKLLTGL